MEGAKGKGRRGWREDDGGSQGKEIGKERVKGRRWREPRERDREGEGEGKTVEGAKGKG